MTSQYTELKNARFIGFSIDPVSAVALCLCRVVIDEVVKNERRTRARRAKDQSSFETAMLSIVGDLLMAAVREDGGWAYRSVSKKSFTDSPVKGDTFNHIMTSLEALGLVESVKGGNLKNPFGVSGSAGFHPGMATRFRVTSKFLDLCANSGLELGVVKKHFKRKPSLRELRLKGTSSRLNGQKFNARSMRIDDNDVTKSIRQRLFEVNSFLIDQKYNGMEFFGLRRIFNEGDNPSFNWNLGWRLYGVGEDSYQLLKKVERAKIKINDEPVVELDINASYLRILHGIRDIPLPKSKDIYAIEGIDRALVKAWVSSTLGHTGFHKSWPAKIMSDLKKAGILTGRETTYPSLQPKVLAHLPVLSDWPECGIRWSHLMYEESEAMIAAMELLRSQDIAALPVHDSLIVPQSKKLIAKDALESTFQSRFGVQFVVK